jgi:hypothetical protein
VDIAALKAKVRSGLAGKAFTLTTAELGSSFINQISDDCFPNNAIRLTEASIEEPAESSRIIVRGKGVDLPFKGMDAEISFYLAGDDAALQLVARGDNGWNLSTGFPPFTNTVGAGVRFSGKPTLYLYSHPAPDGKPQGLTFEGTLDLDSMTGGLANLVRSRQEPLSDGLTLSGRVTLKAKGSELQEIDLIGRVGDVNLRIVTLQKLKFRFASSLDYDPLQESSFIVPYIELAAEISFSAQNQNHTLPVAVQIFDINSDIRFSADLTSSLEVALDDLKRLANSVEFGELLPGGDFQLGTNLKLNEFFFDLDGQNPNKVNLIGVGLKGVKPWPILQLDSSRQELDLQEVQLSFRLFDPFGIKNTSLMIAGEVSLGSEGILTIATRSPDFVIRGHIKEGTTLKFTKILETFLGSAAGIPEIEIEMLSFERGPEGYALALHLEGDLPLLDGLVFVEEARFDISHAKTTGTGGARGDPWGWRHRHRLDRRLSGPERGLEFSG